VVDRYQGSWHEERLDPCDRVLRSDEQTSLQARIREDPTLPPGPRRCRRVAAKDKRGGALQYLAAWDVQQGRVLGRCEARTGIASFGRRVRQVREAPEYRTPCGRGDVRRRVFWVVDHGSSHRGSAAGPRMSGAYPNAILVHVPENASGLNQVAVYGSMLPRTVLTPNDVDDQAIAGFFVELALGRLVEEADGCPSRQDRGQVAQRRGLAGPLTALQADRPAGTGVEEDAEFVFQQQGVAAGHGTDPRPHGRRLRSDHADLSIRHGRDGSARDGPL